MFDKLFKKEVRLEEDEKSENFGMYGRFCDEEFWVSLDGTRRRLDELSDDHLLNLSEMFCSNGWLIRRLAIADGRNADIISGMSEEDVMQNAFNSVTRQAVLKEIGRRWTEKRGKGEI